jgi:hypothetical protein
VSNSEPEAKELSNLSGLKYHELLWSPDTATAHTAALGPCQFPNCKTKKGVKIAFASITSQGYSKIKQLEIVFTLMKLLKCVNIILNNVKGIIFLYIYY